MKKDFPSTDLPFKYNDTPLSGNIINGLGNSTKTKATQVFHGCHSLTTAGPRMVVLTNCRRLSGCHGRDGANDLSWFDFRSDVPLRRRFVRSSS